MNGREGHDELTANDDAGIGIDKEDDHDICPDTKYGESEDLAPVPMSKRTWTTFNFFALWLALTLNIPTWLLATSMIQGGLSYNHAIICMLIGSLATVPPIIYNGKTAGKQVGVPFPVLARASFGIRGAQIAAISRALIGTGWYGIECAIGGRALYEMTLLYAPQFANIPNDGGNLIMFFVFWTMNLLILFWGMDGLRRFLSFKGVFLVGISIGLLIWALVASKGEHIDLREQPIKPSPSTSSIDLWAASITSVVGFWCALVLNTPDFTRHAKSDRAQAVGQGIGLPLTMVSFAIIVSIVTSASKTIFNRDQPIYDPIILLSQVGSPVMRAFSMLAVAAATLAVNLAANLVAPANDFANLAPKYISFKMGGLITGILGAAICPWKLISSRNSFVFTWLVAYAGLLGPLLGIMLADYYIIRKEALDLPGLYNHTPSSPYWFRNGFNPIAIYAAILGVIPNLPGFLAAFGVSGVPRGFVSLYSYSWFIGFGVSWMGYVVGMWWVGRERGKAKEQEKEEGKVEEGNREVEEGGIAVVSSG